MIMWDGGYIQDAIAKGKLSSPMDYSLIARHFGVDKSYIRNHPPGRMTEDTLLIQMGIEA